MLLKLAFLQVKGYDFVRSHCHNLIVVRHQSGASLYVSPYEVVIKVYCDQHSTIVKSFYLAYIVMIKLLFLCFNLSNNEVATVVLLELKTLKDKILTSQIQ